MFTVFNYTLLETQKTQLKLTFIFFQTQLTQLKPMKDPPFDLPPKEIPPEGSPMSPKEYYFPHLLDGGRRGGGGGMSW